MVQEKQLEREVMLTTNMHVSGSSHILYTYENIDKYIENAAVFIAEGLDRHHHIIYIDLSENMKRVKSKLRKIGYSEKQLNSIVYMNAKALYRTHEPFNLECIMEELNKDFSLLNEKGMNRCWGFIPWDSQKHQEIISSISLLGKNYDAYSSTINNIISVCAYDASTMAVLLLNELLQTHEYHMTDEKLVPSHFYKRKAVQFPSITEQIKLVEKAQAYDARKESLSVAGELAAAIAHEIRNPITVIKGFIQLMELTDHQLDKNQYLQLINSETEKIEHIASEFLSLAKPHGDHFKKTGILQLIENVKMIMEPYAIKNKVELHIEAEPKEIEMICDEMKMKQVFTNLIKNAIEAMESGKITIHLIDAKDEIHINITDNGPGMSDDVLNQIGKPFVTTKENGTGLGLLISEKIIDDHKGTFTVRSEVGEGTTFTIRLPKVNGINQLNSSMG